MPAPPGQGTISQTEWRGAVEFIHNLPASRPGRQERDSPFLRYQPHLS